MKPHPITSPPTHLSSILDAATVEPTVRVVGCAYVVDLGRGVQPRLHTIHKDRSCNCGDPLCPAIGLVAEWLKAGRLERAPDPPTGYTPFLPKACPVCGAGVFVDHSLSSRRRGLGWQCRVGGTGHYWQHKWDGVKGWFFRDEILPGLKRGDLAVNPPMDYLPEANRSCTVVRERPATTLELVVVDACSALCGDPLSPSGHVWSSSQTPPPDELLCLCAQVTWREGVALARARHTAEQPPSAPQMERGATT